jgi:hypothetical protein
MTDEFDPTLPLERTHTIPSRWYFDSAMAERERHLASDARPSLKTMAQGAVMIDRYAVNWLQHGPSPSEV